MSESQGPPVPQPTGQFSRHQANCHCGKVRYSFSISPPLESYPVVSCDCSVCQRHGYLLVYPTKDEVDLEGDADASLGSYTFGKNMVHHFFCKSCGSSVFFELRIPSPDPVLMGMNVSVFQRFLSSSQKETKALDLLREQLRMVTDLDLDKLTIKHVEGKERWGKYEI